MSVTCLVAMISCRIQWLRRDPSPVPQTVPHSQAPALEVRTGGGSRIQAENRARKCRHQLLQILEKRKKNLRKTQKKYLIKTQEKYLMKTHEKYLGKTQEKCFSSEVKYSFIA